MTEAFLRLYTAYREEQLALADRRAPALAGATSLSVPRALTPTIPSRKSGGFWPHAAIISRTFDDAAERLVQVAAGPRGFVDSSPQPSGPLFAPEPENGWISITSNCMLEGLARHRKPQFPPQLAYLEMEDEIGAALEAGSSRPSALLGGARALAGYAAAALIMMCIRESRRDASLRSWKRWRASSRRLRADRPSRQRPLQRPGLEKVPFFLIRVDPAGNISKLLDGAGFPFAKHGGACPLWLGSRSLQNTAPDCHAMAGIA